MAFEEPDVMWMSDRSYADKHERVQLELHQYQGRQTFRLRVLWQTPEGQWRWAPARPTSSGKVWQDFGLRAKELRSLGEALLKAADLAEGTEAQEGRRAAAQGAPLRQPSPREQRELDRYDAGVRSAKTPPAPAEFEDDVDIPF